MVCPPLLFRGDAHNRRIIVQLGWFAQQLHIKAQSEFQGDKSAR
jgi:hypothetical protein